MQSMIDAIGAKIVFRSGTIKISLQTAYNILRELYIKLLRSFVHIRSKWVCSHVLMHCFSTCFDALSMHSDPFPIKIRSLPQTYARLLISSFFPRDFNALLTLIGCTLKDGCKFCKQTADNAISRSYRVIH